MGLVVAPAVLTKLQQLFPNQGTAYLSGHLLRSDTPISGELGGVSVIGTNVLAELIGLANRPSPFRPGGSDRRHLDADPFDQLPPLIQCHQHHRLEVIVGKVAVGVAQLLKQETHHLTAGLSGSVHIRVSAHMLQMRPSASNAARGSPAAQAHAASSRLQPRLQHPLQFCDSLMPQLDRRGGG